MSSDIRPGRLLHFEDFMGVLSETFKRWRVFERNEQDEEECLVVHVPIEI